MAELGKLSALQVAVAEVFSSLDEAAGFLVAGGVPDAGPASGADG